MSYLNILPVSAPLVDSTTIGSPMGVSFEYCCKVSVAFAVDMCAPLKSLISLNYETPRTLFFTAII